MKVGAVEVMTARKFQGILLSEAQDNAIHDRVVCELIGRAIVMCPDDIRHQREGYAVTLAAREVVSATKEDKQEALEALMRLRR